MKPSFLLAAALLLSLSLCAFAEDDVPQDAPPWSREAKLLAMELKPVKDTVAPGEDVALELSIKNTGEEPIRIWLLPGDAQAPGESSETPPHEPSAAVTAVVKTPDDREVRLQKPYPPELVFVPLVVVQRDIPQLLLEPGQVHRETIVLNQWTNAAMLLPAPPWYDTESPRPQADGNVDFRLPGRYTVRCEYHHYPGVVTEDGRAVPFQFDLRPAGGPESAPPARIDPEDVLVASDSVTITVAGPEASAAQEPSREEYLRGQIQRFSDEAEGLRNAGRLLEARQHADKAERLRRELEALEQKQLAARVEYLRSQVPGLLEEAQVLYAAGRLEEARQHAEKAVYRLQELEELQQTTNEEAADESREDAAAREGWSAEAGGLVMRLQPSRDAYRIGEDVQVDMRLQPSRDRIGEDVQVDILLKNVSDELIETWEPREPSQDSYPATVFVVGTPAGAEVILGKEELNTNETRLPPRLALKPGETFRQTVTLNTWRTDVLGPPSFETPGTYIVRCISGLDPFVHPYGPNRQDRLFLESPPVDITMTGGVFLGDAMLAPAVTGREPQSEGLGLEVEFQPRDYLPGEPILVRCALVNGSGQPITLSYGSRYEQQNTIFFDIEGPDGMPVPWSIDVKIDSAGPQPLTIPAGRRYVAWSNLLDGYALTKPGAYTINVRYESDGRSFHPVTLQWREDLWKGKLEHPLGAVNIVEPARPADQAALEAVLARARYWADSPYHFLYLFSAAESEDFDAFLRDHGESRYAAYARYGNALAALDRVHQGTPSYAAAAIANLEAIDPADYPALFAEQRLFHLIQAHDAADAPPERIEQLVQQFIGAFPHSPLISIVKAAAR